MNDNLKETMEKLDGEEYSRGKLGEDYKKAKQDIDALTKKGDEMSANISRVCTS